MRSLVLMLIYCLSIRHVRASKSSEIHLHPSHDTFVRRDRGDVHYGAASKITVTKRGANQRIGMMKFDTSQYKIKAKDTEATLMLSVADAHEDEVEVKAYRLVNDFHEDHLNWDTFDGNVHTEPFVTFKVSSSHIDTMGNVDVSTLLRDGKDFMIALVVDEGHVKFYSKDSDNDLIPKLILRQKDKKDL